MIERTEGIITDIIKHNDKYNVVTLYTRQRGRLAFLSPVGKSKTGRMRNSSLQLMAVVSADINIRQGKELYTLRQVVPLRVWHGIYSNPIKCGLLFFITEFCNCLLRQYPADERLWEYITGALEYLDSLSTKRVANFHLTFLIRMLPFVGIEPSAIKWTPGDEFNMQSGEMVSRDHQDIHHFKSLLSEAESRIVPELLRMNFDNMHVYRFSREERKTVLQRILGYYSTHLPIGTDFKTLPVLQDLFS